MPVSVADFNFTSSDTKDRRTAVQYTALEQRHLSAIEI